MSVTKFIIAILSILSIGLISVVLIFPIHNELVELIEYFDFLLCMFFVLDFLNQFYEAKSKSEYLFKKGGWLDLISSIPVIDQFRYARVFRVFSVMRFIKSIKLLLNFFKTNKSQTLYGTVLLTIILIVFVSTYFVLYLEMNSGNIKQLKTHCGGLS